MENLLVSGDLKEKIHWYIRAHGHSSIGGLNLLWTYFSYHNKQEIASVIDNSIKLFEDFTQSEDLEKEIEVLKESIATVRAALAKESLDDEKKAEMEAILSGVDRNIGMIRQILENPGYEEEFILNKILLSAILQLEKQYPDVLYGDLVGPRKTGNRIMMHFNESSQDLKLRCCGYEMQLLLYNILANAVDAIRGEGHIYIHFSSGSSLTTITLSDDGEPLSGEDMERIMAHKEFSTKGRGHGHGLKIVADVLEKYQGKMSVTCDGPGKQVSFTLQIPR